MKLKKLSYESVRELILAAGFFAFVVGVFMIYRPAAFIIGGLILMWLGLPPKKTRRKGGG